MIVQKLENDPFNSEKLVCSLEGNISDLSFVREVMNDNLSYLDNVDFIKWKQSFESHIIFGIGGSSLGGQAIKDVLAPNSNVIFCDTIDPLYFNNLLEKLDLSKTGFLVISKSGETVETLTQMVIMIDKYQKEKVKDHFFVVTENKSSTLKSMCDSLGISIIFHPSDVGGRFSVLSPTGMLVANLMNLNCGAFIKGAKKAILSIENIKCSAKFVYSSYINNILNNVFFIYSERLNKFGLWLSQLLAESTGKNRRGITPIVARGPADQHSQLQLYLAGNKDKSFTFFIDRFNKIINIPCSVRNYKNIEFLSNKSIGDLFIAEAKSTMSVICEENLPTMSFIIDNLTEETLGFMFMYFMLETVIICNFLGVNPFNQPQVERGKIIIQKLI